MNGMHTGSLTLLWIASMACGAPLTEPGAKPERVATGFKFTEGPAPAPDGSIVFTDIPNAKIHRVDTRGMVSVLRADSGKANGLMYDAAGRLVMCEGGGRRLTRMEKDGRITVLADRYNRHRLNSPNDLWIAPGGGIYFSDPRYGAADNLEQDGMHVYYLPAEGQALRRVIDDLVKPNGLIGTPDGKTLYVSDRGAKKTYRYSIGQDGSLSGKTLLMEVGSDGMTLDEDGRIYVTTKQVEVFEPDGTRAALIEVPETPANVCFGGPEGDILYITARRSLYRLPMKVRGAYGTKPGVRVR